MVEKEKQTKLRTKTKIVIIKAKVAKPYLKNESSKTGNKKLYKAKSYQKSISRKVVCISFKYEQLKKTLYFKTLYFKNLE